MTIKSRTLRLPADQAEALEAIAGVDEVSVNEEIQRAVAAHIEARRADPDFRRAAAGQPRAQPRDPGAPRSLRVSSALGARSWRFPSISRLTLKG